MEDEDNWTWFMKEMVHVLDSDRNLTVISDRNQGLLNAVEKVFPTAHHGYYLEYLKRNLRDRLKGIPSEKTENIIFLFRAAAYAPDKNSFHKKVSALKHIGGDSVRAFIHDLPFEHWANCYFQGRRYGEMSSNLAESFNAMIVGARQMPVTKCIDMIRLKIMKFFNERRVIANSWKSVLCPKYDLQLREAVDARATWVVSVSSSNVYEVFSDPSVHVNLDLRTCCCGQWQCNGFPCSHAVGATVKSGRDVYGFIEPYFFVQNFKECYALPIGHVATMQRPVTSPSGVIIQAPLCKVQPGRPRKRRIRSKNENVRKIRCSRCKSVGDHNKATCNAPLD